MSSSLVRCQIHFGQRGFELKTKNRWRASDERRRFDGRNGVTKEKKTQGIIHGRDPSLRQIIKRNQRLELKKKKKLGLVESERRCKKKRIAP